MCGRYTHLFTWKQLHRLMRLTTPMDLPLRYNVAPSQDAPVVLEHDGQRRLDLFRWGLIPAWAKDPAIGYRTINARAESAATTPAFRAPFRERRCLVPASGFYEWDTLGRARRRQPWYVTPSDGDFLAFAGLWESWHGPGHEAGPLRTFTILTTRSNAALAPIHDRMPVILSPEQFEAWLDPSVNDPDRLSPLLVPCPPERLKLTRVSSWVNSPAHEDARCIEPERAEPGTLWEGSS